VGVDVQLIENLRKVLLQRVLVRADTRSVCGLQELVPGEPLIESVGDLLGRRHRLVLLPLDLLKRTVQLPGKGVRTSALEVVEERL